MIEQLAPAVENYFFEHFSQIATAAIILVVGVIIIKLVNIYLWKGIEKIKVDHTLETFIKEISNFFLWVILIVVILSNLGVDVTGVIAGLGVAGIIIGFATKDVLSNVTAGLFVLVNKPYKVGERIEISHEIVGEVREIKMSSTIIVCDDLTYVTVPNSQIWQTAIKNFSRIEKKTDKKPVKLAKVYATNSKV
jgi:small conductance mechanosensitive channel